MKTAVCSWSYRLSAERVAEEMTKCDVRNVHLALTPFVDPLAIVPGTWGEEVEWTKGQVDADAFIAVLKEIGFDGCLAVEREAGNDRPGDIARAVEDLHRRGF